MNPRRITTEDVTGLDLTSHPAEVEITTFARRPVSSLAPGAIPREILRDIERAIADRGYRFGVQSVTVQMIRDAKPPHRTRMRARITYA